MLELFKRYLSYQAIHYILAGVIALGSTAFFLLREHRYKKKLKKKAAKMDAINVRGIIK